MQVFRGGAVLTPEGLVQADVAIEGGRIAAVGTQLEAAGEEIDATGLHVLPGVVDAHVHFNEPGRADWEGFATGSAALAAGGGTCFVDMPLNAHPPTVDAEAFRLKLTAAEASSLTDFALWGGLVPGNVDRLEELAELGVVGFKAFMAPSGIEDFEAVDDLTLYDGMAEAARLGLPVAVHAENAQLVSRPPAGRTWRDWVESRPAVAELEAISRAILFAGETGCSLVREARAGGVDVTCETCPHYLLFDEEDLERLGAVGKCAPPLRAREDRDDLRAELLGGGIDLVASDHSPAPASLKTDDDFFAIWGGISGCQSLLAALLTEGLPVEQVAELTAAGPAARLHLPGKGRLEPGADADLTLIDLGDERPLGAEELFYRHRHSPYVGRALRGRVVRTLVRGQTVFQDGRIVAEPAGRLVRPRPSR